MISPPPPWSAGGGGETIEMGVTTCQKINLPNILSQGARGGGGNTQPAYGNSPLGRGSTSTQKRELLSSLSCGGGDFAAALVRGGKGAIP